MTFMPLAKELSCLLHRIKKGVLFFKTGSDNMLKKNSATSRMSFCAVTESITNTTPRVTDLYCSKNLSLRRSCPGRSIIRKEVYKYQKY